MFVDQLIFICVTHGCIRNILSNDACGQLIHSLVTVRLDYCNSIMYGLPVSFTENSKHGFKNFGSFTYPDSMLLAVRRRDLSKWFSRGPPVAATLELS